MCHLCKQIFNYSTFSSPVAYLEAAYGGWPHIVHKMGKAWRMVQQAIDCLCMRNYYCFRHLRLRNCLLQQQELVILSNWGIFHCVQVGQMGESSALFETPKKKSTSWYLENIMNTFSLKNLHQTNLTDHEIEKKQDYCINRSEHRGKLNIVQIRKITKQLPVVSECC